jgi:hypothetical protein
MGSFVPAIGSTRASGQVGSVASSSEGRRPRAGRAVRKTAPEGPDQDVVGEQPGPADDTIIGGKAMAQVATTTPAEVLTNGVRLVGDVLLPGVSEVVNGQIKSGAAHAAVAFGAAALLGGTVLVPVIWTASALDSFSRSATGRDLVSHFDWRKPAAN